MTVRELIHALGQECDAPETEDWQVVIHAPIPQGWEGAMELDILEVRKSRAGRAVIIITGVNAIRNWTPPSFPRSGESETQ